jgi:hypothetical protein
MKLGYEDFPTAFFKHPGEGFHDAYFTMDQHGFCFPGAAQPVEEVVLISVRREPADRMYICSNSDFFSKDPHAIGPVDQASAEGPLGLIPDDDQAGTYAPQVVLEVVEDPTACHHTGPGDDDCTALDLIQSL